MKHHTFVATLLANHLASFGDAKLIFDGSAQDTAVGFGRLTAPDSACFLVTTRQLFSLPERRVRACQRGMQAILMLSSMVLIQGSDR